MAVALKIQNIYGDFLRSFKIFLDKVTRDTLNKIEWNYGSKILEYHYMQNGHESFEYPNCLVTVEDVQPVDNVGPIARNAGMHVNISPHQVVIAENFTRNEHVTLDKRWVTIMVNIVINVEDVTMLLNYYDLFIGYMPMQYFFYDYKFYTYIEVTPFCEHWDINKDTIKNVSIRPDATYRYQPDVRYKEADPEPHFKSEFRERDAGKDMDVVREGYRYFSTVEMEPILKLQSIQQQTDKETQKHSLTISFEAQIEIPNLLIGHIEEYVETIELVIDPTCKLGTALEYPLLTDMDDKFLINKNISGGVIVQDEDFHLSDGADPNKSPSYLEIKVDINLNTFTPSLWAVEDVTVAQASRLFIPLKHAKVVRNIDDNGDFESLGFYFEELEWFRNFDFDNPFNYLKLILFSEDVSMSC